MTTAKEHMIREMLDYAMPGDDALVRNAILLFPTRIFMARSVMPIKGNLLLREATSLADDHLLFAIDDLESVMININIGACEVVGVAPTIEGVIKHRRESRR